MTFIILFTLGLGILAALAIIYLRRAGRSKRVEDFADLARNLIIRTENGAICRLDHFDSEFWFSFERFSGTDNHAIASLRVSRGRVSEENIENIRSIYESQGFELVEDKENTSLIGKVFIPIDDIWDKASGAQCAHAGRLLLDAVNIPRSSVFRATEIGRPSRRILENRDLLDKI